MDKPGGDSSSQIVRFGAYEADFRTGELRKHGLRVKIQEKPFRLLEALLESPGKLVTREELQQHVWPSDVHVDFETSLKMALAKLRAALCDSADSPRYIETLPKRGYRFICPVERVNGDGATTVAPVSDRRGEPGAAVGVCPDPAERERDRRPESALAERRYRSGWRWAGATLVLASVAAAAFFFLRPSAEGRLGFHQRDLVLVSRFENRTGEPVLNGTVDFAVVRELSNSRFVGVVPPERVGDDLRLMRKSPTTPLGESLAREVCLRDGGVRALITGRVEKIGTTYVLSAVIVDPSTDTQVAGVEEEAKDLNGILPAVRQLSNQLRGALGETLPVTHEGGLKLEKVTTPSLSALQLYSQAMSLAHEDPTEKPIPLLRQALAEDPDFASAHVLLAWCYSNIGKEDLAAPHFREAFKLAGTTSERERLFILGSYYEMLRRDPGRALQVYEALVRLYPDDYWGMNNLIGALERAGRWDDAAEMTAKRADLRPLDPQVNWEAYIELSKMGRMDEARRYLARARNLTTSEIAKAHPSMAVSLASADAEMDLSSGNTDAALKETRRLETAYAAQSGAGRDEFADEIGTLYLRIGKLSLAKSWFEKLPPGYDYRDFDFVLLAEARGDTAGMRRSLRKQFANQEDLGPGTALRLARLGMFGESRQLIARMVKLHYPAEWVTLDRGGLAFYEGRRGEALPLLTEAVKEFGHYNTSQLTMAADLLATALEQQGQIAKAIQTLQPLEQLHQLDLQTSYHLFRLSEKASDAENAQKVEQNLLRRLAYADPDYPILVKLHQQMKLHAAAIAGRPQHRGAFKRQG